MWQRLFLRGAQPLPGLIDAAFPWPTLVWKGQSALETDTESQTLPPVRIGPRVFPFAAGLNPSLAGGLFSGFGGQPNGGLGVPFDPFNLQITKRGMPEGISRSEINTNVICNRNINHTKIRNQNAFTNWYFKD